MRQSAFACGKVRQSLGGNDQVWDSLCILCTSWNVSVASAKTSQGLSTSGLQPGTFACDAHTQADAVVQQPKGVHCMCLVQNSARVKNVLGIVCFAVHDESLQLHLFRTTMCGRQFQERPDEIGMKTVVSATAECKVARKRLRFAPPLQPRLFPILLQHHHVAGGVRI